MGNTNQIIPLHSYQNYAKDFALSHPYCGLFLTMGLGKTAIILETLWELNPACHVLIVAPKNIARCTWQNEIEKWNMPLRTQSLVVNENGKDLSKKKRDEILDSIPTNLYGTVYFINRELIPALVKRFPENSFPFKIVIIDESQSFKSYSSARFKALKTVRPYIERLILLTGSPTPKSLEDLWSQIYLLDMGQRLGKNITAYRNTYFDPGLMINGHPVDYKPKRMLLDPQGRVYVDENGYAINAETAIYSKISDIVISMKNKYIQLPPITYNNVWAYMSTDEMKRYKEFMKTNVLDLANGDQIEAANAAVLSAKLSQMASGAIYCNPGVDENGNPLPNKNHDYEIVHEHKLELCEYIINNTDSPVIIAYHFKSDMDMLMDYLPKHDIHPVIFDGTPQMEKDWNAKKIPVMLIQPASCGFGLNFQHGGHTLIWYTIPWSLEEYEQTNARIYRQGQTEPVIIHHLMTKGTIDKRILAAVNRKSLSQQDLLDAIEATIEEADDN